MFAGKTLPGRACNRKRISSCDRCVSTKKAEGAAVALDAVININALYNAGEGVKLDDG
jgi:hypothetical protein